MITFECDKCGVKQWLKPDNLVNATPDGRDGFLQIMVSFKYGNTPLTFMPQADNCVSGGFRDGHILCASCMKKYEAFSDEVAKAEKELYEQHKKDVIKKIEEKYFEPLPEEK